MGTCKGDMYGLEMFCENSIRTVVSFKGLGTIVAVGGGEAGGEYRELVRG